MASNPPANASLAGKIECPHTRQWRAGTGTAARMRAWMREKKRPFTRKDIYKALSIPPGPGRAKTGSGLSDFLKRGEVERISAGKYRYKRGWRSNRSSPLKHKIFKAMYISSQFAVSDIQRLTGQRERCYIDRIIRELKRHGWLQQVARRRCVHGAGAETIWRIGDPGRFRMEIME